MSLPGGVSVSFDANEPGPEDDTQTWNYPNLHGDNIVQADADGIRVGARAVFDPFGQPIDPATWDIGTTAADDAVTDTTPGDADHSWVGQHAKLYEHHGIRFFRKSFVAHETVHTEQWARDGARPFVANWLAMTALSVSFSGNYSDVMGGGVLEPVRS